MDLGIESPRVNLSSPTAPGVGGGGAGEEKGSQFHGSLLYMGNRPFPHSSEQWHRVEVRMDKNTRIVSKNSPQTHSGPTVRMYRGGMREGLFGCEHA